MQVISAGKRYVEGPVLSGGKRTDSSWAAERSALIGCREYWIKLLPTGSRIHGTSLQQYLGEWIAVKRKILRPNTIYQYEKLLSMYIVPALGKKKLGDLSPRAVEEFYDCLRTQGVGPFNVAYVHRVLHAAMQHAVKRGILGTNSLYGASLHEASAAKTRL